MCIAYLVNSIKNFFLCLRDGVTVQEANGVLRSVVNLNHTIQYAIVDLEQKPDHIICNFKRKFLSSQPSPVLRHLLLASWQINLAEL